MKRKGLLFGAMLSAAMVLSFQPAAVFAGEVTEADTPEVISQEDGGVSVNSFDSDELLMQYIDQKVSKRTGSDAGDIFFAAAVHPRRDVLDVVAGNMYDALAPTVKKVAAGNADYEKMTKKVTVTVKVQ